ncbi:MAG: hypothetical protein A2W31_17635 [Planctomycetes bacterium RBG_16_64_10]|nr:MAG: hypothetical protein A2W31_17635 [Planctomycetes bacterium RBG_16_64_10]
MLVGFGLSSTADGPPRCLYGDWAYHKQLWTVEEMFRAAKTLLQTQPIFHQCDETIRGHVFGSFLALLLRAVARCSRTIRASTNEPRSTSSAAMMRSR